MKPAFCHTYVAAGGRKSLMKRADFGFIAIVLIIFLALLFVILNINNLFATPGTQELAKAVIQP